MGTILDDLAMTSQELQYALDHGLYPFEFVSADQPLSAGYQEALQSVGVNVQPTLPPAIAFIVGLIMALASDDIIKLLIELFDDYLPLGVLYQVMDILGIEGLVKDRTVSVYFGTTLLGAMSESGWEFLHKNSPQTVRRKLRAVPLKGVELDNEVPANENLLSGAFGGDRFSIG